MPTGTTNTVVNHSDYVRIRSKGIKKTLQAFTPERAIAEFVWNGFDAKATWVKLALEHRSFGSLDISDELMVQDNGEGIAFEELEEKFRPFLESQKESVKSKRFRESKIQGDEGRGRLTFFKFADVAQWETVYKKNGQNYHYSIKVDSDALQTYTTTEPQRTSLPLGTKVVFSNLNAQITPSYLQDDIAKELSREFCWFLELNQKKGLKILLDDKELCWKDRIADEDGFSLQHPESQYRFNVRYIRWRDHIPEFSKYYYLNEADNEQFKENTSFNNKGDGFFHSVYVSSDYFQGLLSPETEFEEGQTELFKKDKEPYNFIKRKLVEYLKAKRKQVLRLYSDELLDIYEREGVFPRFKATPYDRERKKDLRELIKTLYQAEPRVFQSLNPQQKKTFIGLLNVLLDSDERDRVLTIIEDVIQLEQREQEELIALLQTTKLNRIIRTIKLIEDRYRAVQSLKALVFNKDLKADEVHDLQAAIEAHYWLFGEEYHLVTAAEPSFEEALRRLIYKEKGIDEDVSIEHPKKLGQMDIFAVRQVAGHDRMESIVVELKHPKYVVLGSEELRQVKRYKSVILSDERFNGCNRTWKFILVGNRYDDDIKQEIESNKVHGEQSLVFRVGNAKIYVKTWDEVFTDFECRHNFLNQKLELEREKLKTEARTKSQVLADLDNNSAKAPPELVIP